jgi:hypothetical protein
MLAGPMAVDYRITTGLSAGCECPQMATSGQMRRAIVHSEQTANRF